MKFIYNSLQELIKENSPPYSDLYKVISICKEKEEYKNRYPVVSVNYRIPPFTQAHHSVFYAEINKKYYLQKLIPFSKSRNTNGHLIYI